MKKRLLSTLLALCMALSLLPGTARAGEFRAVRGAMKTAARNNAAASVPTRIVLPSGVKFIPYSWMPENAGGTYSVSSGTLPSGLDLNAATGEISGVPQTNNTWKFTIRQTVTENGQTITVDYSCSIVLQINSKSYVPGPDPQSPGCGIRPSNDYEITDPVGRVVGDDFILDGYQEETLIIDGPYQEFQRLYIDGRLLVRDREYEAHEGSTVITIFAQTFEKIGKGTHTISAEFRSADGKLKTSSQNYTVKLSSPASGSGAAPAAPESAPIPDSVPDPVPEKPAVTSNPPFGDISSANWFYDDVAWAYDSEIMTGVTADSFAPQAGISQATIVTVLSRMANVDLTKFSNMTDTVIAPGQWYTEAAIWAKQSGLLPDYNVFTGNETITRDQMAIMLSKYLQSMGKDTTIPAQPVTFADAAEMSQAGNDAFQVLYAYDIFRGAGDGRMDPAGSTTRAQFAALIHRVSDSVK